MRFVIVGAGRVGLRTAGVLVDGGHDVVLVEGDSTKVSNAREDDFEVVEGDGAVEETLDLADLDSTDAVGALTSDLNDNFIICMIASEHDCRTVMRIDADYREEIYTNYAAAVDEVIHPERLGAIAAKNALLGGNSRAIADIEHNLQLVEFTITPQSPIQGYSIGELELPAHAKLLGFGVGDEPMRLPTEDDALANGNRLVVLADFEVLSDVRRLVVGDQQSQQAMGGV